MILCFLEEDSEVMEKLPNMAKLKLDLPCGFVSNLEI